MHMCSESSFVKAVIYFLICYTILWRQLFLNGCYYWRTVYMLIDRHVAYTYVRKNDISDRDIVHVTWEFTAYTMCPKSSQNFTYQKSLILVCVQNSKEGTYPRI